MKNAREWFWSLLVMALATGAAGQSVAAGVPAGSLPEPPTGDLLVLSNVTGIVRVLDTNGLVLEQNLAYLPRIQLADLSPAELLAVLETRTAYAVLTSFGPVRGTNTQGAAMEQQLQQAWRRGRSLAGKMQTRLEILADLREYNYNLACLPAGVTAAGQYEAQAVAADNQLTNRAATAVKAAAQVEATELDRAGGPSAQAALQEAHENYRQLSARAGKADMRATVANSEAANAQQRVVDYRANCAAISARLAAQGIHVPGVPPFYPVPPLTLRAEVDAERKAN